ncbi:MAG: hypothetical protein KKG04_07265 [Candidatus Thermoplasmatota archaeon]|nr:hypothetical protein [Candidatus Thermoplasmatota archaeon]
MKKALIIVIIVVLSTITLPVQVDAYFNTYTIKSVIDSNTLILERLDDYYEVDFNYECSFTSFDSGNTIQIDSFLSPGYGDDVVYEDLFSTDICEVGFGSKELNIESYNIIETTGTDKVLVESNELFGGRYLVEYGIGCTSLWIKSFGEIHIDVGGVFLDGISDTIYLFDDNQDCNVWDAEEVNDDSNNIPIYTPPANNPITCPDMINGFLGNDGICYCNGGYSWDDSNKKCSLISGVVKGESDINLSEVINEERSLLTSIDDILSNRLRGRILLQVEKNGEGWYIFPDNKKKYYLGRPSDAFSIMRNLGLGATHEFITGHTTFPDHVLGKILLDVELNGEAYYIYPENKRSYYLGRPDDAFRIMRELGLGITNTDIRKIDVGEVIE